MASVSRLGWVLLVVAVIGATASLFGPHGPWLGLVDIGTTGAALFGIALWSGAWLLAKYPDRIFSSAWPIAERRAWTGLLFALLIFLNYLRFMWALSLHEAPGSIGDMPSRHFIWNLTVLLIAWAVVSKTVGGDDSSGVDFDERDHRIQRMADRAGDAAFTVITVACIVLLIVVPGERLEWWLAPLIAAHVLIGMLIARTLSEYVYLVVSYTRERN
jgi:hypothetical protein